MNCHPHHAHHFKRRAPDTPICPEEPCATEELVDLPPCRENNNCQIGKLYISNKCDSNINLNFNSSESNPGLIPKGAIAFEQNNIPCKNPTLVSFVQKTKACDNDSSTVVSQGVLYYDKICGRYLYYNPLTSSTLIQYGPGETMLFNINFTQNISAENSCVSLDCGDSLYPWLTKLSDTGGRTPFLVVSSIEVGTGPNELITPLYIQLDCMNLDSFILNNQPYINNGSISYITGQFILTTIPGSSGRAYQGNAYISTTNSSINCSNLITIYGCLGFPLVKPEPINYFVLATVLGKTEVRSITETSINIIIGQSVVPGYADVRNNTIYINAKPPQSTCLTYIVFVEKEDDSCCKIYVPLQLTIQSSNVLSSSSSNIFNGTLKLLTCCTHLCLDKGDKLLRVNTPQIDSFIPTC